MKGCRPLKHAEESAIMKHLAASRHGKRNVALFVLGIETGYRITELLSARIGGTYGIMRNGVIADSLRVQRKNMKRAREGRTFYLSDRAKLYQKPWLSELRDRGYRFADHFLFQSSARGNCALSISGAWRVITAAANLAGCADSVSTHSLRKTFAERYYAHLLELHAGGMRMEPIRELSKALGHKDIEATERYLGWKDDILKAYITQKGPRYEQREML